MSSLLENIQQLLEYTEQKTLLYVEDDPFVRVSMVEMLESLFRASNITIATDGEQGLEAYQNYYRQTNSYYDIIITDISMPRLNGDKMSKIILSLNSKQLIILMTAYNQIDSLDTLQNSGVNIIQKPLVLQELLEVITSVIIK